MPVAPLVAAPIKAVVGAADPLSVKTPVLRIGIVVAIAGALGTSVLAPAARASSAANQAQLEALLGGGGGAAAGAAAQSSPAAAPLTEPAAPGAVGATSATGPRAPSTTPAVTRSRATPSRPRRGALSRRCYRV